MSTSLTIYANSSDGHMYARTADHFSNARDAASAYSKDTTGDTLRIGLAYISPPNPGDKYRFYRAYLYFDTSSIPANATILSASVSLYLNGLLAIIFGGFDIYLMNGQPTYPSASLALADFNRIFYSGGGANPVTIISGASGYKAMIFIAAGLASWINKGGASKFCVRTSLDIAATVPHLYMLADFYSSEKGGFYRPKLNITYGIPPTVTTQAASAIGTTSATGNGNIVSIGDAVVTQHGVCWKEGADPVDLAGADNHTEEGAAGTGAFTSGISGLSPSTKYYYRTYATNSVGTTYGNAQSFYTDGIPTLTTQAASAVNTTTVTGNGTIIAGGGENITAHGVIYKLGGDPGTPSDPTTAEGYTDEGAGSEGAFTTSLAGLNHSTRYYCRAYATNSHGTGYGNAVSFVTLVPAEVPIVTTQAPTYSGGTTVTGNGNITDDGGRAITAHGVVYAKWADPVNIATADGSTDKGAGIEGAFNSDMVGLDCNCVYFIRTYATNSAGTSYGEIRTVRMNYQLIAYASTSDGYVHAYREAEYYTYNDAWASSEGVVDDTSNYFRVGQAHRAAPNESWRIYRGFLHFDTSSIPAGATIIAVELYLDEGGGVSLFDNDFNIVIQDGQPTYPHDPLAINDFNKARYSGDGGSILASTLAAVGTITLNTDGRAMITKGGTTKLVLRSSRDIAGIEPGATIDENIFIWSSEMGTTFRPKLTVMYTYDKPLPKINIGGTFLCLDELKLNVGDSWKEIVEVKINVGDDWKTILEDTDAN